jgi:hypothetical protein
MPQLPPAYSSATANAPTMNVSDSMPAPDPIPKPITASTSDPESTEVEKVEVQHGGAAHPGQSPSPGPAV